MGSIPVRGAQIAAARGTALNAICPIKGRSPVAMQAQAMAQFAPLAASPCPMAPLCPDRSLSAATMTAQWPAGPTDASDASARACAIPRLAHNSITAANSRIATLVRGKEESALVT